jgi:hypothetical protein
MSVAAKNRARKPEQRRSFSERAAAWWRDPKYRARKTAAVSARMTGTRVSERTRALMSAAAKRRVRRTGWTLSAATRSRMSTNSPHKGARSRWWKGGVRPLHRQIRDSVEYRLWRERVFKRDNYTCVECRARNGQGKTVAFHAHHIKPFATFPDLRFSDANGVTLCIPCHRQTDSYGGRTSQTDR